MILNHSHFQSVYFLLNIFHEIVRLIHKTLKSKNIIISTQKTNGEKNNIKIPITIITNTTDRAISIFEYEFSKLFRSSDVNVPYDKPRILSYSGSDVNNVTLTHNSTEKINIQIAMYEKLIDANSNKKHFQ